MMNKPNDSSAFQAPEVLAVELSRHLEDQIIFGGLKPGERLVEEDIVRKYSVSRSPVREAFRLLGQDGLVIRESRRGVRVSPISVADLDEVYACRLVLEEFAAKTAADRHEPDAIAKIRRELRLLESTPEGDMRAFFRQNVALSQAIYAASGSTTLRRLLSAVGKQALRYRFIAYSGAPKMIKVSLTENRKIVNAIADGRAADAGALTVSVIKQSWSVIRETISSYGEPTAG